MSKQTKVWTLEDAAKLGKNVMSAVKTYGALSGLAVWTSESLDLRKQVLAAAIEVAAATVNKDARKKGLAVFTTTLKRVRQGDKVEGAEQDMRPFLAFTVDGAKVVGIEWKTPQAKEQEGAGEGGEGEGEEGLVPTLVMTLEQAIQRIKLAMTDEHEAQMVEEQLAELFAVTG